MHFSGNFNLSYIKPTECVLKIRMIYNSLGLIFLVLAIISFRYNNIVLNQVIAEIWECVDTFFAMYSQISALNLVSTNDYSGLITPAFKTANHWSKFNWFQWNRPSLWIHSLANRPLASLLARPASFSLINNFVLNEMVYNGGQTPREGEQNIREGMERRCDSHGTTAPRASWWVISADQQRTNKTGQYSHQVTELLEPNI